MEGVKSPFDASSFDLIQVNDHLTSYGMPVISLFNVEMRAWGQVHNY
jgi:hypothetical protein